MQLKKKTIDDLSSLTDKKVLIRVDFNVPIENGQITNDYRIRSTIPTIRKVIDQGASAILMSHLGRPKGGLYEEGNKAAAEDGQEEFSLRPVAQRLEQILKAGDDGMSAEDDHHPAACLLPVLFAEDCMNAQDYVNQLQPGQILLLENVRFYKNESSKVEDERLVMAKKIASYGDYFVSDAFGTAHRNSATMTGVPKVLGQGVAGYLMGKEIKAFSKILKNDPPRPMVALVGGSKVSDKIILLENLITKVDKLMIGGAMAYTFLKAQGYEIGTSFSQAGQTFKDKEGKEKEITDLAKQLLENAKKLGVDVYLPLDHVCHTSFGEPAEGDPLVTEDENIPSGYMALDIGPKTVEFYKSKIRECKSAIWNGPMGVFEMDKYSNGTFAIAKVMGDETEEKGMISIIGGGDSASAAELSGDASRMYHTSTGGGASLELLEGKVLPGIAILDDN